MCSLLMRTNYHKDRQRHTLQHQSLFSIIMHAPIVIDVSNSILVIKCYIQYSLGLLYSIISMLERRERILLPIAVCKHPLPSTEVKLHNLTHKLTTNIWHITTVHCMHGSGLYLIIVGNDKC